MSPSPRIGIVTRTKNRPVLLRRALESVLFQSYQNWEMVVVNDGGDAAPIDDLVAHYGAEAAGRIRVLHNPQSLGMEGASAVGLAALDSDLISIHDDDDSWAPEFLTIAVSELTRIRRDYPDVQGVTTYCNKVMERIHGQLIHVDSVEAFNSWIPPGLLSFDRMLTANFLPPISFVFSRTAFDALDHLYEPIPYLGDWDFLVRFLCKYDVFMIPQYLAFYHWRTGTESAWTGNSVTGEIDRHAFYRQLLLNRWLRADLSAGRFGIGAYANLRTQLEAIVQQNAANFTELARLANPPAMSAVAAPAPVPAPRRAPWPLRVVRGLRLRLQESRGSS